MHICPGMTLPVMHGFVIKAGLSSCIPVRTELLWKTYFYLFARRRQRKRGGGGWLRGTRYQEGACALASGALGDMELLLSVLVERSQRVAALLAVVLDLRQSCYPASVMFGRWAQFLCMDKEQDKQVETARECLLLEKL